MMQTSASFPPADDPAGRHTPGPRAGLAAKRP